MARARQAAHNAPAVVTPQGRLTLTTGTPVMTAEAAAQTTIYYTPYVGDRVPLYNGTEWENKVFTELSIAMAASANWATASNFDLFVYNDAGTLRLVTGAAWTNDTTRAEALVRTNGIWLNNATFTGRYGAASTVSIAASRATYVGTMRTSAAGTTTWELGGDAAGGNPIKLYLWNAYNRRPVGALCSESTNSWSYATATWRPRQNSSDNGAFYIVGLAEDFVDCIVTSITASGGSTNPEVAVGVDSTSVPYTTGAMFATAFSGASVVTMAAYAGAPGIGYRYLIALEYVTPAATATFYGDNGLDGRAYLKFTGMF